jgi:hypothetical protein
MKKCAYCDTSKLKITKEHVVNKSFIDQYYKVGKGYANVYQKYTENYLTAKDVCAKCNNEILGSFDDYFLRFYANNLPVSIVKAGDKFKIQYEFEKLSKWLLKTIYNSERKNAYSAIPQKMHLFKDYIIGKENENGLFKIYLEILSDVDYNEWKDLPGLPPNFDGKFNFLRLGTILFHDQMVTGIKDIMKHITSSNFMFHVFILNHDSLSSEGFKLVFQKYLINLGTNNLYYIDPSKTEINVIASARSIIDNLKDTFEGDKHFMDSV